MLINRYKQTNIVEDRYFFLKTMLDLELYLVEFNLKDNIKVKIYPNSFQVKNTDCQSAIVITYNEYLFYANNRKTQREDHKGNIFLCSKQKKIAILVLDFP